MKTPKLVIKAAIQIQKPADEVFEAIADPARMANYFISWGSGRMEEGKTLSWRFPEFDMEFAVRVGAVEKDRLITYYWDTGHAENRVEIRLDPQKDGSTVVRVTEGEMEQTEEGLAWLAGNTEGWANFLACLKAWLEYGINLRKGAFLFRAEEGG